MGGAGEGCQEGVGGRQSEVRADVPLTRSCPVATLLLQRETRTSAGGQDGRH